MRYVLVCIVVFLSASMAGAGYRETFEKEFLSKPWGGQPIAEKSACIACHTSDIMKPSFRVIPDEWQGSWHALNEVQCHNCHGGDPKDESMAMSHVRGFVGKPKPADIPEFCGKCHIGIMRNYIESGHGLALKASGKGPTCVTCHGNHNVQKASIDIINEQLCTRCHSYERARIMKQALFVTEKKITEIEKGLKTLRGEGVYTEELDRTLFGTQARFRALFHTVDVELVKEQTDQFASKLDSIDETIQKTMAELRFRRNYAGFLMLIFLGLGIVLFLSSRTGKE